MGGLTVCFVSCRTLVDAQNPHYVKFSGIHKRTSEIRRIDAYRSQEARACRSCGAWLRLGGEHKRTSVHRWEYAGLRVVSLVQMGRVRVSTPV